jgi:hypothetical protein
VKNDTEESLVWRMHRDIIYEIGHAMKVVIAKCWAPTRRRAVSGRTRTAGRGRR